MLKRECRWRCETGDHGIALVMTLIALGVFAALGLALVASTSIDRLASANYQDRATLFNAGDAALHIAIRDLARIDDWSLALQGVARSSFVDGPAGGSRATEVSGVIDLTVITNQLSCGRTDACSDAQIDVPSIDRPWGMNNPRWQLFASGGLHLRTPKLGPNPYVAVWIGDDAGETDGDRAIDGGGITRAGRHVVRVRAMAFGLRGGRVAIDATLVRPCTTTESGEVCEAGIRVQSWRLLSSQVP